MLLNYESSYFFRCGFCCDDAENRKACELQNKHSTVMADDVVALVET